MTPGLGTTILENLLRIALITLAGYAANWVRTHHAQTQLKIAGSIAQTVVQAAEQIGEKLGWTGPQKYTEALNYAKSLATRVGLRLTDQEWRAVLESAVVDLKMAWHVVENAGAQHEPQPGPAKPPSVVP